MGGTRGRRFDGANFEPRKAPSRPVDIILVIVQDAILGNHTERESHYLKRTATATFTKLLHERLPLAITKKHNLPERSFRIGYCQSVLQ
jgi:hypothetical protein